MNGAALESRLVASLPELRGRLKADQPVLLSDIDASYSNDREVLAMVPDRGMEAPDLAPRIVVNQ